MDTLGQKVVERHAQMKRGRSIHEAIIEEGIELCQPNRGDMTFSVNSGDKFGQTLYDDTGVIAANMYANSLQGMTSSAASDWFRVSAYNAKANDNDRVREWLVDEVQAKLYAGLHKSNYYGQKYQFLKDGITGCTATKFVENNPREGISDVIVPHPREIYYTVDKFGSIQCLHRYFNLSIYSAAEAWGLKNLSKDLQQIYKVEPYREMWFLYINYPNTDPLKGNWNKAQRKDDWLTGIVEFDTMHTIEKTSEMVRAFINWRPRYNINETYGRCPASDALVSLNRCNLSAYGLARAEELSYAPPLIGPHSLDGRLDITPYVYTGFDAASHGAGVEELFKRVNVPWGIDLYERIKQAVNEHFLVPYWSMMMAQAPPLDKVLTATQTMGIQTSQAIMLGPIVSSMKRTEGHFFNRMFYEEFRNGRIAPPPKEFENYAEKNEDLGLELDFIGPLYQSQRSYFKNDAILRGMEAIAYLKELLGEKVLDRLKANELVEYVLEANDWPEKLLASDDEVEQIQATREQQQAEIINMQKMKEASETTKNLQRKTEEGSPLAAMGG